jgi:hypothetical protein
LPAHAWLLGRRSCESGHADLMKRSLMSMQRRAASILAGWLDSRRLRHGCSACAHACLDTATMF